LTPYEGFEKSKVKETLGRWANKMKGISGDLKKDNPNFGRRGTVGGPINDSDDENTNDDQKCEEEGPETCPQKTLSGLKACWNGLTICLGKCMGLEDDAYAI